MAIEHSSDPNGLPHEGLVPIRTVASLTGVNPVTLRAWERRYGLIKPVRTPKGHRLYTMGDVDLIHQVVALLEAGMSISQVRQVVSSEQAKMGKEEEQGADLWAGYQRRMMQAIIRFDTNVLDELYNDILSLYPVDIVISRLIVPLLQELGWRWEHARGGVAEEHFFTVYLRNKLGARFHHLRRSLQGPKLLTACMPGEQHEIGILLFALAAMDRNYRVVLLGANSPLEELPLVAERADCQAIVLSGCMELSAEVLHKDLGQLIRRAGVPVFIGGKITTQHCKELTAAGAILLGDDLNLALHKIDTTLVHH
jgi:DNA-binding transcriptional MerR regulator/methylmalonyl-CoA mutase cobalamin-binding subunit